jgi:catechol 2,3-dioxygenase-like lactoylglutathione lyase family enzyme
MKKRRRTDATKGASSLSFNHAILYVRDVSAALHFYADLLNFRVIEKFEHNGVAVYARLRSPRGSSTLGFHALEPGRSLPDSEGVRLYFEVKNVEGFCKKLEASGVKFVQAPKMMPWGWKHAYLKDPDGHELSLYWAGKKRFQKSRM